MALADPAILQHTLSPPERRVLDAFAASVREYFQHRVGRARCCLWLAGAWRGAVEPQNQLLELALATANG